MDIRQNLRRLIKLFGVEFGDEAPVTEYERELDRRWRWRPDVGFYNGRVYVEHALYLVQYKSKREEARIVASVQFQFLYDPRRWSISGEAEDAEKFRLWEQWHGYYDGPHCFYRIGPFAIMKDGIGWCLKCMPD